MESNFFFHYYSPALESFVLESTEGPWAGRKHRWKRAQRWNSSPTLLGHTVGPAGILVPQPGIEPTLPAVEVQTLNHWPTREVPETTGFPSSSWDY